MTIILQANSKLIKNLSFGLFLLIFIALKGECAETFKIINSKKQSIITELAITSSQQSKGLSGVKPKDFSFSKGMLFINKTMGPRRFWMPDTYFNLDIIFLDASFKIVGIEKNVPAHPGKSADIDTSNIYKTKTYDAQFVLEIKAGAPFGKELKIQEKLIFKGPLSLSEIILKTHH